MDSPQTERGTTSRERLDGGGDNTRESSTPWVSQSFVDCNAIRQGEVRGIRAHRETDQINVCVLARIESASSEFIREWSLNIVAGITIVFACGLQFRVSRGHLIQFYEIVALSPCVLTGVVGYTTDGFG